MPLGRLSTAQQTFFCLAKQYNHDLGYSWPMALSFRARRHELPHESWVFFIWLEDPPASQSPKAISGPRGIKLLHDGDGAIQLRNLLGDGGDFQAVHLRNHQALARLSILRWRRRLESRAWDRRGRAVTGWRTGRNMQKPRSAVFESSGIHDIPWSWCPISPVQSLNHCKSSSCVLKQPRKTWLTTTYDDDLQLSLKGDEFDFIHAAAQKSSDFCSQLHDTAIHTCRFSNTDL